MIGAAAMVMDQLFAREHLSRWIEFGTPAGRPGIVVPAGSTEPATVAMARVS